MNGTDRLLLVEGKDDQHTILHLIRSVTALDETTSPTIAAVNGVDNLLSKLPTYIKSVPFLGIVVDANGNPGNRWKQLRDRIVKAGVACPPESSAGGAVIAGLQQDWRIGVWMMPDNQRPGSLEIFLEELIPEAQEAILQHARSSTDKARDLGAPFRNAAKARMHTWLAWQETPGQPYGSAVRARSFDPGRPLAGMFTRWMEALYTPDNTPLNPMETKG